MPYFTLWMLDFFNTIQVSNSLNSDQARHLLGLILVQTVCKGYQQTTKVGKEQNAKKLVVTTVWLKPWLKLISSGNNFFHLAKVLAATNSEPELVLRY